MSSRLLSPSLRSPYNQDKLLGVQQQLTDLNKFGVDMVAYNASLANINALTSHINATYPDGHSVVEAIFYVAQNISLLQVFK
jgi:hypothetical protein